MADFLRKYRFDIFLWLGLIIAYLATRLTNLGIIPIFTDEAIYLRWSQIMASDAALRFLPLTDGKPPLFMWLTSVVMRLLSNFDPFLSGRLVSVFAGLGGLLGVYFASFMLFRNKKISYLSCIFYLLSPFTLFYDRFALADSLLATISTFAFGLSVLLVKTLRLDVAMILGVTVGLGLLTKPPAQFLLFLFPVLLLLFKFEARNWKQNLLKLSGLFVLVVTFAQSIFSVLRLFPLFSMIKQKELEFIVPVSYLLRHPFEFFPGNIQSLLKWEFLYLTPFVALAVVLGLFVGLRKHPRQTFILSAYFSVSLAAMAAFNKIIYPRYLLLFTPLLLILAGSFLGRIKKMSTLILVTVICLAFPVYTDAKLLFDPVSAPLLQADRDQYLDGWSAGFGVKEVRAYLATLPGHNVIATEGTFGLMPYALELYQKDYPNLEIKAYWPLPPTPPPNTNYLLMYQNQKEPVGWKLQEVLRFRQGRGKDYLRLYKLLL